jgi:SAM-dependent methyltransferase
VTSLLHAAEELEEAAALERVSYLAGLGLVGTRVLDAGCGNGYFVGALAAGSTSAVGVDRSLYRMSRWLADGRAGRHLLVADAAALPFATATFDTVIASGMLEHVGVAEHADPYRVTSLSEKARLRAGAVGELRRVCCGVVVLDFPNGWFPIDFWHGDTLGAFRVHGVPDTLNPTLREVRSYLPGARVTLLPLRDRLRFRQISRRWWGRALSPIAALWIRLLDRLPRNTPLLGAFYPFLVMKIEETHGKAS